jgi:hypothetical protein
VCGSGNNHSTLVSGYRMGPVGCYKFPAYDNSPAAPSHSYYINAHTDPTGIEPGPLHCNISLHTQPTIEVVTWRPLSHTSTIYTLEETRAFP